MFSKSTSAEAKSIYSVSSTASTLKGAEAPSRKWITSEKKDHTTKSKASKNEESAIHHEAIATYLALR
ncbi:hypothetical protein BDV59DRAFT_180024 [Aspergillus ambiguus]|uniref:uncharacterized protein n=1 Tax=Aspergillus ambiguus TaxID=176160 RepID=UPI003CCD2B80